MKSGHALRHLGSAMGWDFEKENKETSWLRLMSRYKYDSYRDFWAGSRFPESLLCWICQFDKAHREDAYKLLKDHLIYISAIEMQQLVNRTYPVFARNFLVNHVSRKCCVPLHLVWKNQTSSVAFNDLLKRTLFIGLSDGARIDGFRRANSGVIANDQVALGYELSDEKWNDLHKELKKRTSDENAKFEALFLIDDFTGSGKTLLRFEKGKWKGKLKKFAELILPQTAIFSTTCEVYVHHYIGTERAQDAIMASIIDIRSNNPPEHWFGQDPKFSFDLKIKNDFSIIPGRYPRLDNIFDSYYDSNIETESLRVGGNTAKYGFADCGLALVLEHNTPNNSVATIWAESDVDSQSVHKMKPLFRRRQRHL